MSVDFNELYQEFIQLTSPPSSTSSVPSPPPLPPELSTPTSGQCHIRFPPTPEKTPRKSVLIRLSNMNSIPDPRTPGTPSSSEQSISPSGACPVTSSNINSPPGGMMTSHHHYEWSHHHTHPQQHVSINQSAEKRKDITGSLAAPPNSPAEPPAKKPALQGVEPIESVSDNNNNMNGGGNYHELNSSVLPGMKSLVGPTGPSCIVTNIRNSNSGNVDSVGYMDSHNAGEEDGTDCVIIQKQPPLNELRRLLSAPPVGHNSRSPSQAYPPPQHGHPCMSDYGNSGNDDPGMAGWNIQQISDHHSHNIHHHQSMNNDMRQHQQQHQHQQQQHPQQHHQQHQQQQQQQQHHGPPPLIPYPHPIPPHPPAQEQVEDMVRFQPSWTADTPTYPGGLEVLWREVPEECKGLITPQDVQETARLRGYFTVCELLALKRTLTSRYTTMKNGQIPYIPRPPMTETAMAAAAAAAQAQEIQNAAMGFAGSGSVVKEALAVLHDENPHHQQQQQQCHQQQQQNEQSSQQQSMNSGLNNHSPSHQSSNNNMNGNSNGQESGGECGGQGNHSVATPIIRPTSTPPPPYRTTTLVFKLLVIGNYRFRSFSEANPNRLRVLFNTHRLSYECHLPMVPSSRDSSQMLRKVLTIDVGFEQISQLTFGYEELHLRVEGRPVLNVAYTPAGPNELPNTPQLGKQDEELLDQIEKGQLKLTANHSLYFINQRLVHQLENQFKDHPRLKQLFSNCGQGTYSSNGR